MNTGKTTQPVQRSRPVYLLLSALVMGSGLLLRSRFLHWPPFIAKYGADSLWALLVFCGFALLFCRASTPRLALLAVGFAWGIEFSQLYHSPWTDQIRSTRIGALVLGATFNWPDLLAYAIGVSVGALADCFLCRRK